MCACDLCLARITRTARIAGVASSAAFVILAILIVASACEKTQPSRHTPVGGNVTRYFVKDANSGRCLRIEQQGRYTRAWVTGDEMCEGENHGEPRQ